MNDRAQEALADQVCDEYADYIVFMDEYEGEDREV